MNALELALLISLMVFGYLYFFTKLTAVVKIITSVFVLIVAWFVLGVFFATVSASWILLKNAWWILIIVGAVWFFVYKKKCKNNAQ